MSKADKKRKSEATLLATLCENHGYAFADTLPASERSMITMTRPPGGKVKMASAVVVRLMAPSDSALGKLIAKEREAERVKGAKQTKRTARRG